MSLFDGKPIGRVDFSPKPPVIDNLAPGSCPDAPLVPISEQQRIWEFTRLAAEASNISGAAQEDTSP
jgi:hypothetical protein